MPAKNKRPNKKKVVLKKSTIKKNTRTKSVAETSKGASLKPLHSKVTAKPQKQSALDFPVVGIGASAGGLEALNEILANLPKSIDLCFVLVQHQAPDHPNLLPEILQRVSTLVVAEAKQGTKLAKNHLFVSPANVKLDIHHGKLSLAARDAKEQFLPINHFFNSLAKDQNRNAIGIILSGGATDGTLGLKAIKSENGITLVQSLESARCDSMPASAIAAGCADFVLRPEQIAQELIRLASEPYQLQDQASDWDTEPAYSNIEMDKVFEILKNRTGNDFTLYKHNTIRRRIGRRMLFHKISRFSEYVEYLSSHPSEQDALFRDILINVTAFFRDPETFDALKKHIYPKIMKSRHDDTPIRIWVSGCSSGEEVYSLIISLMEYLGDNYSSPTIQVFATDIDEQAIEKARLGIYPESMLSSVSKERLRRYFSKVPQGYQINKNIREMCVFAIQNIVKDPPFSHLDIVSCRNMMIYMGSNLQRKVLQTLHYALNPGGYLLLGSSETAAASADLFSIFEKEKKIYKKKDIPSRARFEFSGSRTLATTVSHTVEPLQTGEMKSNQLVRSAENVIMSQYSSPAILVNERLDILQFFGRTGPYLDPTPGQASLNLTKLIHPNLTLALRVVTHEALRNKTRACKQGVRFSSSEKTEEINIDVVPIQVSENADTYYLVVLQKISEIESNDTSSTSDNGDQKLLANQDIERYKKLEQELEANKIYMHSIIKEHEASNEELQSANEEIQSTNEELQSTNEELETAKEELQSTNEELKTVNDEYENRNAELITANNDLRNTIASANLPLVMLNEDLIVRYFSPETKQIFNIVESDIGRPINNLNTVIDTGDISGHARRVIETLNPYTSEVLDDKGNIYSMKIRPYRTEDNRITGVVIIFFDFYPANERLLTAVKDSNDAIIVQSIDGIILAWNPTASKIYEYSEHEAINSDIGIIIVGEQRREMMALMQIVFSGELVRPFEAERVTKSGQTIRVIVTMSKLNSEIRGYKAIATTEHLIAL